MSRNAIFVFTPLDGKCQNLHMSLNDICTLSYRFTDIQIFYFVPLKKVGHGQLRQLHRSIANVKIYKFLPHVFKLALIVSEL